MTLNVRIDGDGTTGTLRKVVVSGRGVEYAECKFKRSNWCCGVSELGDFTGTSLAMAAAIDAALEHPEMRSGIFATTAEQGHVAKILKSRGFVRVKMFTNTNTENKIKFWFRTKNGK